MTKDEFSDALLSRALTPDQAKAIIAATGLPLADGCTEFMAVIDVAFLRLESDFDDLMSPGRKAAKRSTDIARRRENLLD